MMSCLTSALLIRCFEQILERTIIYTVKTVNENEIRLCADVKRSGESSAPLTIPPPLQLR